MIFPGECCLTSKISDFRNIPYAFQTICRLPFKERNFPNSFQKYADIREESMNEYLGKDYQKN